MLEEQFSGMIKLASSKRTVDDLLKKISTSSGTIQIFSPNSVISRAHLIGAYADALMAFEERRNVSSSIAVEMMLYAAMTRQINDAIKLMGAKSNKNFIVFADSAEAYSKLKGSIENEKDFNPPVSKSLEIAKRFGIKQKEGLDDFVLQKMALSLLD